MPDQNYEPMNATEDDPDIALALQKAEAELNGIKDRIDIVMTHVAETMARLIR